MRLLAIDTATEACSAAVLHDGGLAERFRLAPRAHNRLILPMIEELLAESGLKPRDLDAIAFGRGPGSFTGVRIAAGVTQGIALGLDLPVIPVSTLAALALEAMLDGGTGRAFTCIDARMGEVYWAVYRLDETGEPRLEAAEMVGPAAAVAPRGGEPGLGIGSGWATYEETLSARVGPALRAVLPDRYPRAAMIARLAAMRFARGETVPAASAQPVYLRDKVANKPGERPG